jgi:hypothetical protein
VVFVERQHGGERTSPYSRAKPTDVDANRSPVTAQRVFSRVCSVCARWSVVGAVGVGRLQQEEHVSVEWFGEIMCCVLRIVM